MEQYAMRTGTIKIGGSDGLDQVPSPAAQRGQEAPQEERRQALPIHRELAALRNPSKERYRKLAQVQRAIKV